jgi:hypothetical protein
MTSPLCPVCGSSLGIGSSNPFPTLSCAQCGWDWGAVLRRDSPTRRGADAAFLKQLPSGAEAQYIFPKAFQVPAPRRLVWTRRMTGAVIALLATACFFVLTAVARGSTGETRAPAILMILSGWLTLMLSIPLVTQWSNRRLLREGEVTAGRVVYQKQISSGRSTWSLILYAFADAQGCGFIGRGRDFSDSIATDAPVLVYYDRSNPAENVAAECTTFELRAS